MLLLGSVPTRASLCGSFSGANLAGTLAQVAPRGFSIMVQVQGCARRPTLASIDLSIQTDDEKMSSWVERRCCGDFKSCQALLVELGLDTAATAAVVMKMGSTGGSG